MKRRQLLSALAGAGALGAVPGSPASARVPRLMLRPRLTRRETSVSYALLTSGIQRSLIGFKSRRTLSNAKTPLSPLSFSPEAISTRGSRGVAIGCGHGNLLGMGGSSRRAIYADVSNRLRNSADWDKQDAQFKQQIADKQKALDDAKQKVSRICRKKHARLAFQHSREP